MMMLSTAPTLALCVEDNDHLEKAETRRPAPPLILEQLLQAPPNARVGWNDLQGKVVVINFWATWCAPCSASRPLFNRLEDKFHDQPVVFLSITDENKSVVSKYLRKYPRHGWVGIDTDRSTFNAYGVSGIPKTAIIDSSGNLVGWTNSDSLYDKPEILQKVIDGNPVTLSKSPDSMKVDLFPDFMSPGQKLQDKTEVPLCLILIRPASGVDFPFEGTLRERRVDNLTLPEIVAHFYRVQLRSISFDFSPSDDKYDIFFHWPDGDISRGEALLRDAIKATFDITVQREKHNADVVVLTVEKGRETSWELARASARFDPETGNTAPNQAVLDRINAGESFFYTMGSTQNFANGLSYVFERSVIDESAIDGYYSFYFPWNKETSSESEAIQILKSKYGVILTPVQREISMVVVRKG